MVKGLVLVHSYGGGWDNDSKNRNVQAFLLVKSSIRDSWSSGRDNSIGVFACFNSIPFFFLCKLKLLLLTFHFGHIFVLFTLSGQWHLFLSVFWKNCSFPSVLFFTRFWSLLCSILCFWLTPSLWAGSCLVPPPPFVSRIFFPVPLLIVTWAGSLNLQIHGWCGPFCHSADWCLPKKKKIKKKSRSVHVEACCCCCRFSCY